MKNILRIENVFFSFSTKVHVLRDVDLPGGKNPFGVCLD